ncbi:MAG: YggT family protein [Acidobacteria bacterium]|nr:YggT family protein [Acidobacteriota bacterium]
MTNPNDLLMNETHRLAHHEAVKDEVRSEVQEEINTHASAAIPGEQSKAADLGHQLRHKAFNEVAATEAEIDRARTAARISQIIDFVFYIAYSLIGLQILLDVMGARRGNGFRNLIDTLSAPLLGPFESLIQSIGIGRFQLKLSYVFAFIFYILLHIGVNALLRLFVERKTTI